MKKMTDGELSAFAQQLAMILHAGISALEGISILREDACAPEDQELLDALYEHLERTGSLEEALRGTGVFPDYFVQAAALGEHSGTLDEVMDALAGHYERQNTLTRSIRSALTYPLILLTMLSAVLLVLMTRVMPVFEELFSQLGVEITGISAAVFRLSRGMQTFSAAALILAAALVLAGAAGIRTKAGRRRLLAVLSHLPAAQKAQRLLACSRFSDALAVSLHSGLPIEECFSLAASLTDQPAFSEKLQAAESFVLDGTDLGEALQKAGIFTGLNARMLTIGFRTGSAEAALQKISADCQEEADDRIQAAVEALEPVLTAILSILTGLILVSVMLPLLGVMTNIR